MSAAAGTPMDPGDEQRLRDEVIYLHSLWHQGPPPPPHSDPLPDPIPLSPIHTTQFKRKQTHITTTNNNKRQQNPNSSPGAEWPCPPTPPPVSNEWPTVTKHPSPNSPITPEENSKLSGLKAQKNALEIARKFLLRKTDDSDAIGSSGSDDESMDSEGDDGREEYDFYVNLLTEDAKLKEYYVKNYVQGEFSCLVCGALGGKKMGKKYGSCLALVQHSIAISNPKSTQAHRAFGQAVCKVLSWDIDQLSSIASLLSEKMVNADLVNKERNVNSIGDVGALTSEHASSGVQVNVDSANNKETLTLTPSTCNIDSVERNNVGVVAASGGVVSLSSEHTSGYIEGNVCGDDKATACNVHAVEGGSAGLVSVSVVGSVVDKLTSVDTQNDESDNWETSIPLLCNVYSVEGNVSKIVPESGATLCQVSPSSN